MTVSPGKRILRSAANVMPVGPASDKVWMVLNRVGAKGALLPGYQGGKPYVNSNGLLSKAASVTYREWEVNPYTKGVNRGSERLVTGSDGSAYFTSEQYDSFMIVRGPA